MDGDSIGLIIVMVILLALSAFFSATETAFSTFNRIRMKSMAQLQADIEYIAAMTGVELEV